MSPPCAGATGFTGRLVCEHVAHDYKVGRPVPGLGLTRARSALSSDTPHPPPPPLPQGKITWAMAGRNQAKLEALRLELSKTYGEELLQVPILTGDLSDQTSLDAIARQARVVLSTAGPFLHLGTPLLEAAVRGGAHYVDTTGEVLWVRKMIAAHHDEAEKKGLRLVPCCGYDSIPSGARPGPRSYLGISFTNWNGFCGERLVQAAVL